MRNVVLVTGGRDYTNIAFVWYTLDQIHKKTPITLLVQGGATGADSLAEGWAIERVVPWKEYPVTKSDWKKLGKKAGPLRNRRMLEIEKPDLVVAFPGGRGTADCKKQAKELKIPVQSYTFGIQVTEL